MDYIVRAHIMQHFVIHDVILDNDPGNAVQFFRYFDPIFEGDGRKAVIP